MSEDSILENLDEIISKEEILKLYESVVKDAKPIMLAKDVCKCACGNCSCNGTATSKGCC